MVFHIFSKSKNVHRLRLIRYIHRRNTWDNKPWFQCIEQKGLLKYKIKFTQNMLFQLKPDLLHSSRIIYFSVVVNIK